MTMGQRIAQKRKEQGLSQEGLGEQLGVSRQAIYKWESGAAVPEIDKLIALSRLFGVSVGWLLGVEELPQEGSQSTPEADASATAPEETAGELTEAQLQMVEEIVERYTAALPKPLSPRRRRTLKLAVLVGAVCLAGVLYSLFGSLDRLGEQYNSLQNNLTQVQSSVDRQIGSVSSRVEEILKAQNSLVADYGVEISHANLEENRIVFSARVIPKTYVDGMTVKFSADNGTGGVSYISGTPASDGGFTAALACGLTDSIVISAVFETPDGTRSTQLLEQFSGLYSASLPAVDLMCYDTGELLGLQADKSGLVTLPEVYITTQPNTSGWDDPEAVGCSEAESVQVGLFKNKTLIAWLEPCDKPERFQGTYEGESFYHLPEGTTATLTKETDQLRFAAVVTDVYGRQAVYSDIPYLLSDGELTWPDTSDLSDHDPAGWEYGQ